jgi:hypothetical protein
MSWHSLTHASNFLLLVIIVSAPFFCQYGFMVKLDVFDFNRSIPFGKRHSTGALTRMSGRGTILATMRLDNA